MTTKTNNPNRLAQEKSPYLLQHAHNPVDWYPWSDEAFANAKAENKPLFLSIGYSTCHWCHVMERESFEDPEVAELLNRHFIAIKVDREERPDVDHIYMEFCQALTGAGGWPLSVFMTPEKRPFYVGTYFPKERRYGRLGMMDILSQLGELWSSDEQKIRQSADEIYQTVTSHKEQLRQSPLDLETTNDFKPWAEEILQTAYQTFSKIFDRRYGGFGRAPKFPSPHNLTFLLRYAQDHADEQAYQMVRTTLDFMAKGGIYDHIGYGFARYSTDQKWLVPHFEKMLYDNALLAIAYLESYQYRHQPQDEQIAREIFTYVLRDMTSPEGAFYSAEDADSEGIEGKFYVWTPREVKSILGPELGELYCEAYDITEEGNFEGENIPNLLRTDWPSLAEKKALTLEELSQQLAKAREKLYLVREKRIHPYKDDKILTSWNGLMIAALAKGAQILSELSYAQAAERAVNFIRKTLYPGQRLLARYRDGDAAHLGYLDDYAFLIWGLLELYTATGKPEHLEFALTLQEEQNKLFFDAESRGYYLTGTDAEVLLIRPKEIYDGALPSGNSVSALNLLRLARITGDEIWEKGAEEQTSAFRSALSAHPHPTGYTAFLQALQFSLNPSQEIILSGNTLNPGLSEMKQVVFSTFHPYSTVLYHEGTLENLIPWLKDYPHKSDQIAAYVCENFACQRPVYTPSDLGVLLEDKSSYTQA